MGLKKWVLHFAMRPEKPILHRVQNLHFTLQCAMYSIAFSFFCNRSSCAADNTVELIVWAWETYFHYKITRSLLSTLAFLKK